MFLADIALFVILSGFTTALQLREARPGGAPLDLGQFLASRALGIYPVLWLVLLLNAPRWALQTRLAGDSLPPSEVAVCAVLNVLAMQAYIPACDNTGPGTSVYYASIIISAFVFYGLLRKLVHLLDDRPPVLPPSAAAVLARIRTCSLTLRECVAYTAACVLLSVGLFLLASLFSRFGYQRNGIGFFPYFLGGVLSASLFSCLHAALYREAAGADALYSAVDSAQVSPLHPDRQPAGVDEPLPFGSKASATLELELLPKLYSNNIYYPR